jgi:hypothetical protein
MGDLSWRQSAELVGMAAIVASLVFVGLQLKQSQDIAISTQYNSRTSMAIDIFSTQLESGDLNMWARLGGLDSTTELSPEDLGRLYLTGLSYLTLADNHYYQFQNGFLDDESWNTQRRTLKRQLAHPASASRYTFRNSTTAFRDSFIELCNELIAEIESESGEI